MKIIKGIENFVGSRYLQWIGIICVIIAIPFLLVAGFGLGAAILLAFLLGLIIFFGFLGQLAGAIITVVLLNQVGTQACKLLNIWFADPRINQTLEFLMALGYIKATVTIFFILSSLSIFTGSIRIFRVSASTSVKNKGD